MRTLIWLLILCPASFADILQMKDGSRVEWVSLKDCGDTYEAETPQGKKVVVKKAEVDRFLQSSQQVALTGAVVTRIKSPPVNLMAMIQPKRDSVSGEWKISAAGMSCSPATAVGTCRIEIPYSPSDEYDLEAVVECKEGEGEFVLGLVAGGKQFGFMLDGSHTNTSGLCFIDGQFPGGNETGVPGRILIPRKPKLVTVCVRKENVSVLIDGKLFINWKADYKRCSLMPLYLPRAKDRLFVCTAGGTYNVSRLTISEKN